MTDDEFEALKAKQKHLWYECEALRLPYEAKRTEWHEVYCLYKAADLRREVVEELRVANEAIELVGLGR